MEISSKKCGVWRKYELNTGFSDYLKIPPYVGMNRVRNFIGLN